MKICAVVPAYDNAGTIGAVVATIRGHDLPVIVVDDGSATPGREVCAELASEGAADVVHLPQNGGKGVAVRRGFERAAELGYTHVFQVDGDGQHDLARMPAFVAASEAEPDALVLGAPDYDESAPRGRRIARRITKFWVDLEVGRKGLVQDAMVGFRVYPLAAALSCGVRGRRMDFDVEILVLMIRRGCPVVNLPVAVSYPEGGVSHFSMFWDNVRFSLMHSRLCAVGCWRWVWGIGRRAR